MACDSVLKFEKELSKDFKPDRKYTFIERNRILTRTYSEEFTAQYNAMLAGQVERQMANSIKMVSDLWYTCWVNAGQPDLRPLANFKFSEADKTKEAADQRTWLQRLFNVRVEGN